MLIQELELRSTSSLITRPHYIYCSSNIQDSERSKCTPVLNALVKQLGFSHGSECQASKPLQDIIEKFRRPRSESFKLDLLGYVKLITALCERSLRPVTYILVDALDECEVSAKHDILESLLHVMRESTGIVKLLISSREDDAVHSYLKAEPSLIVDAKENSHDIGLVIDAEIKRLGRRLCGGHMSQNLRHEMMTFLNRGATGMCVATV